MQMQHVLLSGSRSFPTRRYHIFAPSLPAGYGHGQATYYPRYWVGGPPLVVAWHCLALLTERPYCGILPDSTPRGPQRSLFLHHPGSLEDVQDQHQDAASTAATPVSLRTPLCFNVEILCLGPPPSNANTPARTVVIIKALFLSPFADAQALSLTYLHTFSLEACPCASRGCLCATPRCAIPCRHLGLQVRVFSFGSTPNCVNPLEICASHASDCCLGSVCCSHVDMNLFPALGYMWKSIQWPVYTPANELEKLSQ